MILPKYLVRYDDHTVFSINEDNKTYSTHQSNLHQKYKYDVLIKHKFYPCEDKDLDGIKKAAHDYYKKMNEEFEKYKSCGD